MMYDWILPRPKITPCYDLRPRIKIHDYIRSLLVFSEVFSQKSSEEAKRV